MGPDVGYRNICKTSFALYDFELKRSRALCFRDLNYRNSAPVEYRAHPTLIRFKMLTITTIPRMFRLVSVFFNLQRRAYCLCARCMADFSFWPLHLGSKD